MTFDQWEEAMAKEVFLQGDENPNTISKVFEMVEEDLMEEES